MIVLLLSLLLSNGHARCKEQYDSDALLRASQKAVDAFGANQMSSFHRSSVEIQERVLCLDEIARPDALARMYVSLSIQAFLDKQPAKMSTFMQVARYLDPGWTCSDDLGPMGHPLRLACEQATGAEPFGVLDQRLDVRGTVFVDGLQAAELPAERPFVAQQVLPNGNLHATWLIDGALPPELSGMREDRRSRALGGAAMVGASLATGLWVGFNATYNATREAVAPSYEPDASSADPTLKELSERLAGRQNWLAGSALVASSLTVGLATAAIVVKF